ncbi:acyltransferase family protein [Microbacterium sp. MAHUQ-60]|uniref:acyltransferase family protein n=1 Tax=unclassified Microbacterium TaxID=2609290 RepID=UPI0036083B12
MTLVLSRGPSAHTAARSPRIVEIEGLRGIALTLVVLFHLFGNGRISGGVDVFLVISAFLLSRSMFRKASRPEGARLAEHFSGVGARLVPSAAVVLAAVGAATLLFLPPVVQRQNLQEILASALYFENWELIRSQLSYGAAGPNASPLQHFWSLSMQGQFFLVWPFLVVALVWIARRIGASAYPVVLCVTMVLTGVSAIFSWYLTSTDQEVAYFHTFARFWELGLGAILGLTLNRITLGARVRMILISTGIVLVSSCGFFIDGGRLFPGPWTLWPVAGTLLVILGSGTGPTSPAARLLGNAVLAFFARISYALYLWHWPLLVFYLQLRDRSRLGLVGACFIFVISVVLAWLTTVLVEDPVARLRLNASVPKLFFVSLAATLTITVGATVAVADAEAARAKQLAMLASPSTEHVGAGALTEGLQPNAAAPILPDPSIAFEDLPAIYGKGCIQNYRSDPGMDEVLVCESEINHPKKTIVMSGGSHVQQWYPAVAAIADQENWAVVVIDKDGCRLAVPDASMKQSESCESWNEQALPKLIDLKPDAIFTVGTETASPEASREYTPGGQVGAWRILDAAGIPVITVRDTPRFPFRVPECAESAPTEELSDCGLARDDTYADTSPFYAADPPPGVAHIDLSDAFCTPARCDAVVGNVFVYRDDDHMTATYARTLAPALRKELQAATPWLF